MLLNLLVNGWWEDVVGVCSPRCWNPGKESIEEKDEKDESKTTSTAA